MFVLLLFATLGTVAGQQCDIETGKQLNGCLGPLQAVVRRIVIATPEVNTLALPMFSLNQTHVMEMCDLFDITKECVSKEAYKSCPEYIVWNIVNDLFSYPCGDKKNAFFAKYSCINEQLAAKKECLDGLRVPEKAHPGWNKCSRAPDLHKCISGDVKMKCGDTGLQVFEETLSGAGCSNFKRDSSAVRRKPVSEPAATKSDNTPNCSTNPDCQDLVTRVKTASVKSNITHPLFLLTSDDFDQVCNTTASLQACSTCKNNPAANNHVSKVATTVNHLCKDRAELGKALACVGAIKEHKSECLEEVMYEKDCEGISDFGNCIRVVAMTHPACRLASKVVDEFVNQC